MKHKEGELYRVLRAHGKEFAIYYGYYGEEDRIHPNREPIEVYPNFKDAPVYTKEGIPFATAMQTPCAHFRGEPDDDNTCYQCAYYVGCEELLGVCRCEARRGEASDVPRSTKSRENS